MSTYLSSEALRVQKAAASASAAYRARAKAQAEHMQAGPRIIDGVIIIPSSWYNPAAAKFWRRLGAYWRPHHREGQCWILHPDAAEYDGRRYSADAWLTSLRRKFSEFWPGLNNHSRYCVTCGQEYDPWHPDQQFCTDCTS